MNTEDLKQLEVDLEKMGFDPDLFKVTEIPNDDMTSWVSEGGGTIGTGRAR